MHESTEYQPPIIPDSAPITLTREENRTKFIKDVDQGILPPLKYAKLFFYDPPKGRTEPHIPSREYTQLHTELKIPVTRPATPRHPLTDHDAQHIPDYQVMYDSELFANLVQTAAKEALSGDDEQKILERCSTFTGNMDWIANMISIGGDELEEEGEASPGAINNLKAGVRDLISLVPNIAAVYPEGTAPAEDAGNPDVLADKLQQYFFPDENNH